MEGEPEGRRRHQHHLHDLPRPGTPGRATQFAQRLQVTFSVYRLSYRQDLQDFSGFGSMRKILRNPVNPVYFWRSLHVALRRIETMKTTAQGWGDLSGKP